MREQYIAELAQSYARQTGAPPDLLLDLAARTHTSLVNTSNLASRLKLADGRAAPFIEAVLKLAIELNASGAELAAAGRN